MAENKRAEGRNALRDDFGGSDPLADLARIIGYDDRRERLEPVTEGFQAAAGQKSNVPAMADLEDELMREFALYDAPRSERPEPSFEPDPEPMELQPEPAASEAPGADVELAEEAPQLELPASEAPADDVELAEEAPQRELPVSEAPAADVELAEEVPQPEMSVSEVIAADAKLAEEAPKVELRSSEAPAADADLAEEPPQTELPAFVAPVEEDDTMPPLEFEEEISADATLDVVPEPAEQACEVPVSDFGSDFAFSGPVPEIEFDADEDSEPQFSGPVPDFDFGDDLAFSGPVPELDADEAELHGNEPTADHTEDALVGELELSLGAVDLQQDELLEPVSHFAEWKNDRLSGLPSAQEPAEPAWAAKPFPLAARLPEAEPVTASGDEQESEGDVVENVAESDTTDTHQAFDNTPEPEHQEVPAAAAGVDEPAPEAEAEAEAEAPVMADLEVPSDIAPPRSDENILKELLPWEVPAEVLAAAQTQPVPKVSAPAVEAEVQPQPSLEPSFDDFDFSFDEAEIEAEVSKAVLNAFEEEAQNDQVAAPSEKETILEAGELPFDATQIGEIDNGMPPVVSDLAIPVLPGNDSEPDAPAASNDFDYDIEAEMAELFAIARKEPDAGDLSPMPVGGEAFAGPHDEFDRALEADILRSVNESIGAQDEPQYELPLPPARSGVLDVRGRPVKFGAIAAGALVIVLGGAYFWYSGGVSEIASSGAPKIILADKTPFKTVPKDPGGKEVPNQDKAVYDRVSGDNSEKLKQDSLITAQEVPLNPSDKTLGNDVSPMDDEGATPADNSAGNAPAQDSQTAAADARLAPTPDEGTAPADNGPVVTPRKVKTMIVLPNGTLVTREDGAADNGAAAPAASPAQSAAPAQMATPAPAAPGTADTASATVQELKPTTAPEAAPSAVDNAALAAAANADAAAAPANTAPVPVPTARPTEQPVNVIGTVTDQGHVVADAAPRQPAVQTASAPQAAPASLAPGTYVIQIASLPSEAEARKSWTNLSSKFASVLAGKSVDIKSAEIPGKGTYYRVRVVAGTKDDAIALCQRYRAAGGSCLVSR